MPCPNQMMSESYYLCRFITRHDVKFLFKGFQASCLLSEEGGQCGSSGRGSAVSFSSAVLGRRVSLDQLKVTILAAVCPIYTPSDMKWPWLGTHRTPARAGLPHTTACGPQVPSGELIWGRLPETGRVIHLLWHPCCPTYLAPKVQINKKFTRYLQWTTDS